MREKKRKVSAYNRRIPIPLSMSRNEYNRYRNAAKLCGMSLSGWLRYLAERELRQAGGSE